MLARYKDNRSQPAICFGFDLKRARGASPRLDPAIGSRLRKRRRGVALVILTALRDCVYIILNSDSA